MTRVAGSIPITSDLSLSFDRDVENFHVQVGSYSVTLSDHQLRVVHAYRQGVVLAIPATLAAEDEVPF